MDVSRSADMTMINVDGVVCGSQTSFPPLSFHNLSFHAMIRLLLTTGVLWSCNIV